MGEVKRFQLGTVGALTLSVVSPVLIVLYEVYLNFGKSHPGTIAEPKATTSTEPLLLNAVRGIDVERPPVWLMRQAGRYMKAFIVLSCIMCISVNFSTFLVIGKTSPVTYQVLGHLKTCLVLAFGYILPRDPLGFRLIALIAMVLYSYYCTRENHQKAAEVAAQASQAREDESILSLMWKVEVQLLSKRPLYGSKDGE